MQMPDLRFWREVLISAFLAVLSVFIAAVPPFDHFGGISLALIAGMLAKALFWKPSSSAGGLVFAAKTLLRVGIVLLGLRLNFAVLVHSGIEVVVFDLVMIILGIALIMLVLRRAGFEPTLAALAAVGSSICGASAIAAAAPAIRANKESSALAIVVCTLIGTFATFLVIPLQSIAGLAPAKYGILAGATLHEVAQVVAAVTPFLTPSKPEWQQNCCGWCFLRQSLRYCLGSCKVDPETKPKAIRIRDQSPTSSRGTSADFFWRAWR
jgi:uncharacterized integral membrane protein (TIGR00698 family)